MSTMQIDRLLDTVVKRRRPATFTSPSADRRPFRLHGHLREPRRPRCSSPTTWCRSMKSITPERNQQELQEEGGTDFGFAYGDMARFRVSVFRQRGDLAIVLSPDPQPAADVRADRSARDVPRAHPAPPRHVPGDRPHRLGQDDHAGDHDRLHQPDDGPPHHHDGRPDRVLPQPQEVDGEPARSRQRRARASRRPSAACCVRTPT